MANVLIYSTPTCGYCKLAKAFFKEKNIEFTEKDVALDEGARQEMFEKVTKAGGQPGGVPVIFVDDTMVMGFDKGALSRLLGI